MPEYVQHYFIDLSMGSSYPYTYLLSIAMVLLLLGHWERSKRVLLTRACEFLVLTALHLAANCILYTFVEYNAWIDLIIEAFLLVLYAVLRSGLRTETWFVRTAIYLSFSVLNLAISEGIGRYMDDLQITVFGFTFTTIVTFALSLALAAFLRYFSVENFSYVPQYLVVLIAVVSMLGAIIEIYPITTMSPMTDYTTAFRFYNLSVCTSFLALEMLAYYMFYALSREYSEKTDMMAQQHKAELDADVLLTARQTYENLREVRHEIKNHDAYMKALLDAGEYDKLRDYFDRNTTQTAEVLHTVQSGNQLVDAVINNRITRAKLYNIEVQTMLAVPPQLTYEENDLCSLLSNLMDNAIEGCEASGVQGKERTITVSVRPQNGYFFIRVTNPAASTVHRGKLLDLRTTKEHKELHGNGIKIIRRIAEKYRGCANFSMEDDQFVADVMLAAATPAPAQKGVA